MVRRRPLSLWRAWPQDTLLPGVQSPILPKVLLGLADGLRASSGSVPGLAPRTWFTGQARRAVGTQQMGSPDEGAPTPARASGPKPVQGGVGQGRDVSVPGPQEQPGPSCIHATGRFDFASGIIVSWYLWHFLIIEPMPENSPSTGARKHCCIRYAPSPVTEPVPSRGPTCQWKQPEACRRAR